MKLIIKYLINKILKLDLRGISASTGWGLKDNDSYLFLWGPITENLFKHHRGRNYCLGNPLTDNLYNKYLCQKKDNRFLGRLGCDLTKKTILLSAECLLDYENKGEILQCYRAIIKDSSLFNFIIKVHPRDNLNNFETLSREGVIIIKDEYDFRTLLRISDLNISNYSATSMEALIYGIPVILLPQKLVNIEYWFGSDIFFKPKTVESCVSFIKEALTGSDTWEKNRSKREEYIQNMFSEHVGHSRAAVINKINELLYN